MRSWSLASVNDSHPTGDESRKKLGAYLSLTSVQVNTITSAMFVTAMAGNPLAVGFAADVGVGISWGTWALAAIVPGLVALTVMAWFMAKIHKPGPTKTPEVPAHAREELKELGPMSRGEWTMLATFVLLLVLWELGDMIGVDATSAAFVGGGWMYIFGMWD